MRRGQAGAGCGGRDASRGRAEIPVAPAAEDEFAELMNRGRRRQRQPLTLSAGAGAGGERERRTISPGPTEKDGGGGVFREAAAFAGQRAGWCGRR